MELVKVGTCEKKTYLVAVPKQLSTTAIEEEVGYRLGLQASPDGYEICLISRSAINGLGLRIWSIFEEVY